MTNEEKQIIEKLRDGWCYYYRPSKDGYNSDMEFSTDKIADLIERLTTELEQVRRERDAAINYIHGIANEEEVCIGCKYSVDFGVCNKDGAPTELWGCKCGSGAGRTDYWEWRGGCDENGGI